MGRRLSDALETKLVGVTIPLAWIKKIEEIVEQQPMVNVQDYIREAIKLRLEFKEKKK